MKALRSTLCAYNRNNLSLIKKKRTKFKQSSNSYKKLKCFFTFMKLFDIIIPKILYYWSI